MPPKIGRPETHDDELFRRDDVGVLALKTVRVERVSRQGGRQLACFAFRYGECP